MIKAVFLDWGNTVMRDFGMPHPMSEWGHVEAMPGVRDAMAALKSHGYRIYLATNTDLSGETLVREALARVGLDRFVDAVFASNEMGTEKPDGAFYAAMMERTGLRPHEAAMVGDSYANDVAGAKDAGLWAVWYNEDGNTPPPGFAPCHDAELRDLRELPAVIQSLGR